MCYIGPLNLYFFQRLLYVLPQLRVHLGELIDDPIDDTLDGDVDQSAGDVLGQPRPRASVQDVLVHALGLAVVVVVHQVEVGLVAAHVGRRVGAVLGARLHLRTAEAVRVVVGGAALVVDHHFAVALEVAHSERAVDRDLVVVDAEAVAVGVRVGEHPALQESVR